MQFFQSLNKTLDLKNFLFLGFCASNNLSYRLTKKISINILHYIH